MRTQPKIQASSNQIRSKIVEILTLKKPELKVFNFKKTPFQTEDLPLINVVSPNQLFLRSPDGGNYTRTTKVELQIIAIGEESELDTIVDDIQNEILDVFMNDMETLNKTIFNLILTDVKDIPSNDTERFIMRRHVKFDAITHDGTRLKTQLPPNLQ